MIVRGRSRKAKPCITNAAIVVVFGLLTTVRISAELEMAKLGRADGIIFRQESRTAPPEKSLIKHAQQAPDQDAIVHGNVHHRRLSGERYSCPDAGAEENNLRTCNNPNLILQDSTVVCVPETCQWDLDLLDPIAKPAFCRAITINAGALDQLPDSLEPCYWWERFYGIFRPTPLPMSKNTLSVPSARPSIYDRSFDQTSTSDVPSTVPSPSSASAVTANPMAGSGHPTTTTPPSNTPTRSAEPSRSPPPTISTEPTGLRQHSTGTASPTFFVLYPHDLSRIPADLVELDPIFVTLMILPEPASGRKLLRQLDAKKIKEDYQLNYDELRRLAAKHILTELQKALGEPELVRTVELQLHAIESLKLSNGTQVETVAISGHVKFGPTLTTPETAAVNQMVTHSLTSENSIERFMALLHEATDPALQRTYQMNVGLTPGLEEHGGAQSQGTEGAASTNTNQESGMFWPPQMNYWWIGIIAGGGAGLIGFCVAIAWIFTKRRHQRHLQEVFQTKLAAVSSSSPTRSGSGSESPVPVPVDGGISADRLNTSLESAPGLPPPSDTDQYEESEASTSVYSYTERTATATDDHSQMTGLSNSCMYGAALDDGTALGGIIADDQSRDVESTLWSLSEAYGGKTGRKNQKATPIDVQHSRPTHSDEMSQKSNGDGTSSLSRMVVLTSRSNRAITTAGEYVVFAEDLVEDELSMASGILFDGGASITTANATFDGDASTRSVGMDRQSRDACPGKVGPPPQPPRRGRTCAASSTLSRLMAMFASSPSLNKKKPNTNIATATGGNGKGNLDAVQKKTTLVKKILPKPPLCSTTATTSVLGKLYTLSESSNSCSAGHSNDLDLVEAYRSGADDSSDGGSSSSSSGESSGTGSSNRKSNSKIADFSKSNNNNNNNNLSKRQLEPAGEKPVVVFDSSGTCSGDDSTHPCDKGSTVLSTTSDEENSRVFVVSGKEPVVMIGASGKSVLGMRARESDSGDSDMDDEDVYHDLADNRVDCNIVDSIHDNDNEGTVVEDESSVSESGLYDDDVSSQIYTDYDNSSLSTGPDPCLSNAHMGGSALVIHGFSRFHSYDEDDTYSGENVVLLSTIPDSNDEATDRENENEKNVIMELTSDKNNIVKNKEDQGSSDANTDLPEMTIKFSAETLLRPRTVSEDSQNNNDNDGGGGGDDDGDLDDETEEESASMLVEMESNKENAEGKENTAMNEMITKSVDDGMVLQ